MKRIRFTKILTMLMCAVMVVMIFPIAASADTGPKASVRITFKNMGDELCYGTLLSEKESTGPSSAWDGKKKNIFLALCITAAYLLFYLIGRFIWCDIESSNLIGWLFTTKPTGEHSYLYGWLLSSNLFIVSMLISAGPALFGKYKFSFVTAAGFIIGFLAGMLFGPNPDGAAIGQTHYGWAIWGVIYFLSVIAGILVERFVKKDK